MLPLVSNRKKKAWVLLLNVAGEMYSAHSNGSICVWMDSWGDGEGLIYSTKEVCEPRTGSSMGNTHRGGAGAAQVVCRIQAGHRTLGGGALLLGEGRLVDGFPQEVVHAAVGPVVDGRGDLQHVCGGKRLG